MYCNKNMKSTKDKQTLVISTLHLRVIYLVSLGQFGEKNIQTVQKDTKCKKKLNSLMTRTIRLIRIRTNGANLDLVSKLTALTLRDNLL